MTVTINGTTGVTAPEVTLDNSVADGGQVVLKSSGYSNWNIDNYNGSLRNYYGSTVATTIDSSGNVGIGTSSPSGKLHAVQSSGVAALSQPYAAANFENTYAGGGNPLITLTGSTTAYIASMTSAQAATPLAFATGQTERMRINSSGQLLVGTTNTGIDVSNNASGMMYDPGNFLCVATTVGGASNIILNKTNSSAGNCVLVRYNGSTVGSITNTSTATAFNTSSDYRLKENIQPMQNALGVVAQLNPVTYTWKADGSDGQGFIAHELQAVVPDCVAGEKDAVDAEGNPVYQGIDTSFLVATLTKAIQEQQAQIETLTAKVAALEIK